MSQSPQTHTQPSSTLPIIALVCVFLCMPLGLILAIVALIKTSDAPGSQARTLSIVALAANALLVPVIGIMAAIAIPNFVKFQCGSKESEAKGNLKALYVAEESYRAEVDSYDADFTKIGFSPRGTRIRYRYVVDAASKTHFHAVATVDPQFVGELHDDRWEIDDKNALTHVTDGCN